MSSLLKTKCPVVLLSAKQHCGKSVFIKYVLCTMFMEQRIKYGIVFCPTAFTGSYDFIPSQYVYNSYDINIVKRLMGIQVQQKKQNGYIEPAFIVFDDCIGSMDFNSNLINKLITSNRHYNLTIFLATQYLFKIPPLIRDCVSYFICFRQKTTKSVKAIYETYMQDIGDYRKCYKFIEKNTKDYYCIIVDNDEDDKKKYKVTKAPLLDNAKLIF